MYDKACNLYDRIREDDLEPDNIMYGCLMKFAVRHGRYLTAALFRGRMSTKEVDEQMLNV